MPWFLYQYIFSGNLSNLFVNSANTSDYITFIVIGTSSFAITFSTIMNVGRSLIVEQRQQTLNVLKIAPISISGYMLGVFLEQFFRSSIEFLLVLLVGKFLGANIYVHQIPELIFYIVILSIASFSISSLVAWLMIYSQNSFIVQNTFISILLLISGVTIPLTFFPEELQLIGKAIPVYWAIESFRSSIISGYMTQGRMGTLYYSLFLSFLYLYMSNFLIKNFFNKM